MQYTSERFKDIYSDNQQAFIDHLKNTVNTSKEVIVFDFIHSLAEDTLALAKYYCPVETGRLRDSLSLQEVRDGFMITSDCDYSGYVHEILRYYHESPTRAGFLIDAFQETMYDYMQKIGVEKLPNFSVALTAVPTLSLAFYNNNSGSALQLSADVLSNKNKVASRGSSLYSKSIGREVGIRGDYKSGMGIDSSNDSQPWVDYFNPLMKPADINEPSVIDSLTGFLKSKNPDYDYLEAYNDYKDDLMYKNLRLGLRLTESEINLLAYTFAKREISN